MSLIHLYRASDQLVKHHDAIESRVFTEAMSPFGLSCAVTLFDLTNTYLSGSGSVQSLAKHGRSKCDDRPPITLALVLDGSGFVRCSNLYVGNAAEPETLQKMLQEADAPNEAVVIMDRRIATALQWFLDAKYRYLVVSRERAGSLIQQTRR